MASPAQLSAPAAPQLKTHRPTGQAPWPLILVTGEPGAGKSWELAEFSGSPRIGRFFWLDLGEGRVEEYGQVPGANYEVLEHNGTYVEIIGQIEAVHAEAQRASAAGEPPVVLGVDSMTAEWAMLSEWTDRRARRQKGNLAKLKVDPDAEIDITSNLWNDANNRHNRIIHLFKTFPGIVVMIASEKEVTIMDRAGNPTKDKEWKPEGHKFLARDCSVWVRFFRESAPQIIKAVSVHYGVLPWKTKPKKMTAEFSLDWLVFDMLKCDPAATQARPIAELDADQVMPDEAPATAVEQDEANLRKGVKAILGSATLARAGHYLKVTEETGLGDRAVTHLVTEADREALGLREDQAVTLLGLAQMVVGYCRRHGEDHRCDGNEHVSAHGPRNAPENPGQPIQVASNGAAVVS